MIKRIINKVYYYWYKQKFKQFGYGSTIKSSLKINGYENIEIGRGVNINYKTWLAALPLAGSASCTLKIGDGACIGNFNHIYATKKIEIGKNVLTADKVYISDNLHGYENIEEPIINQSIKQIGEVKIGDGTWLGENVCVIGVTIGKNCVVGANAVVTKNIPDYSVAVGNPAKIIKRYCLETKQWRKTTADGKFID